MSGKNYKKIINESIKELEEQRDFYRKKYNEIPSSGNPYLTGIVYGLRYAIACLKRELIKR